jgi:ribosomal protein L12E/L44/L45/RPP1/RPP2
MLKKSVPAAGETAPINDAGALELGPPVLLEGEDIGEYERLLARVTAAVVPADIIEEFWVRDVVDLVWEALRLRRLKASLLLSSTAAGLQKVLAPIVRYSELPELVKAWYGRDKSALQKVTKLLEQAGLTMDHVMAETLSAKLDDVERIDRMIANAEARRHVVLREIDRHRAAVAARLRAAGEAIEEGEFEEVPGQGARQVRAL